MTLRTATDAIYCADPFSAHIFYSVHTRVILGRRPASGYATFRVSGLLLGYFQARLNHISRSDDRRSDGEILSNADSNCCRGFPADGKVESMGRMSDGNYRFRYTEGPKDKAFMEKKDREYLTALKDSDDPTMQARFEEEYATLDLSLEHHRNLKREFEPFTQAYREAAGGGGEGGGPRPPAADAASTPPAHDEEAGEPEEHPIARDAAGSVRREPFRFRFGSGAAADSPRRIVRAVRRPALISRERDDQAAMSVLRRQILQQGEQLRKFQTELDALRTERTEARNTMAALRGHVSVLVERLATSQNEVMTLRRQLTERLNTSEAHFADRLEAVRTGLQSRLEASTNRLDEITNSHDSALTTLTRSLEAQKRNLLRSIRSLDQRLHRVAGRAHHEEHRPPPAPTSCQP